MDSSSVKVKKAIVKQKQVLSIDNNWRNTEICHRSESVSHDDARGSLRHVSWDKEFTPYAWNLSIRFTVHINRAVQSKAQQVSKNTMYLSGLIPTGTLGVRVGSCLPPALPGFPGRLTSPFQSLLLQGCKLWNHTEWSPTWQSVKTTLVSSQSMVCTMAWQIVLQHIALACGRSAGFSVLRACALSLKATWRWLRWIQRGKYWWSPWFPHLLFGGRPCQNYWK